MTTPSVSVVVAAFNAAPTIARAIASVRAQTLADWELIVVDDASTDSTAEIVGGFAEAAPRIRLITMAVNQGQSTARNAGIAAARGQWVAILDADDAYEPDRLATLVSAATAQGLDLIADNQLIYDAPLGVISRTALPTVCDESWSLWNDPVCYPHVLTLVDYIANSRIGRPFVWGLLKPVFRRQFLLEHSLAYQPAYRMSEDFLLLCEALIKGARAAVHPAPLYVYTTSRGDISGKASGFSTSTYTPAATLAVVAHIADAYVCRLSADERRALTAYAQSAITADHAQKFKSAVRGCALVPALRVLAARPALLLSLARSAGRAITYRLVYRYLLLDFMPRHD
ncbi:MAG: glycosyltransferase family 2 protein [Hyphomicrobiaceae bacterium]